MLTYVPEDIKIQELGFAAMQRVPAKVHLLRPKQTVTSRILSYQKHESRLVISQPLVNDPTQIQPGLTFDIDFTRGRHSYRFKTVLLGAQTFEGTHAWVVQEPKEMMFLERRQFFRVPAPNGTQLFLPGKDKEDEKQSWERVRWVLDISGGGVGFVLEEEDEDLIINKEFEFVELHIPEQEPFRSPAKIVGSRKMRIDSLKKTVDICGLRFDCDKQQKERLFRYTLIRQRQMAQRERRTV